MFTGTNNIVHNFYPRPSCSKLGIHKVFCGAQHTTMCCVLIKYFSQGTICESDSSVFIDLPTHSDENLTLAQWKDLKDVAAEISERNKFNLAQRMSINHVDLEGGSWFEHLGTKWQSYTDSKHDHATAVWIMTSGRQGSNSLPAGRARPVQQDLCEHHQYSLFFTAMISYTPLNTGSWTSSWT